MPRIVGITNARHAFAELIRDADEHGEPIYITHFNEPKAVIIGYAAWEQLQQRLEDLEDMVAIYRGREEPRRPFADVWADIEAPQSGESERELQRVSEPAG